MLLAPMIFIASNLCLFICLIPSAKLNVIIRKEAKAAERIFELSPTPKTIKNKGKMAVAGVDLKKSKTYETAEYIFLNLPRIRPMGIAAHTEIMKDSPIRIKVLWISESTDLSERSRGKTLATSYGDGMRNVFNK